MLILAIAVGAWSAARRIDRLGARTNSRPIYLAALLVGLSGGALPTVIVATHLVARTRFNEVLAGLSFLALGLGPYRLILEKEPVDSA